MINFEKQSKIKHKVKQLFLKNICTVYLYKSVFKV